MKEYCVYLIFALVADKSFCMDLRNKRQVQNKNFNQPNQGLLQNPRGFPFSNQVRFPFGGPFPDNGRFPSGGSFPDQNTYPFDSSFYNQGKLPFDDGRYHIGEPFLNDGIFPIGRLFPDQVRYPFESSISNQGKFPFGSPFLSEGRFPFGGSFPNKGRFPFGVPFPSQGRFPNQGLFTTQQTTTQKPSEGFTTPAENSTVVKDCLRNCPVTNEYNPVCGTDSVTYPNPGRLMCAQTCGISVTLLWSSPCHIATTVPPV